MSIEKLGYPEYNDDLIKISSDFGDGARNLTHVLMLAFSHAQTRDEGNSVEERLASYIAQASQGGRLTITRDQGLPTYMFDFHNEKNTHLYRIASSTDKKPISLPGFVLNTKRNSKIAVHSLFYEVVDIATKFHALYKDHPNVNQRFLPLKGRTHFTEPAILVHLIEGAEDALTLLQD